MKDKKNKAESDEKRRAALKRASEKALKRLEELIDGEDTPKSVLMSAINEAIKLSLRENESAHGDGENYEDIIIRVMGNDD